MQPKWLHNGCVASITIKKLPESLHLQLKRLAKAQGRSLNKEIVSRLNASISLVRSPEQLERELEEARKFRQKLTAEGFWTTDEEINRLKRQGRL